MNVTTERSTRSRQSTANLKRFLAGPDTTKASTRARTLIRFTGIPLVADIGGLNDHINKTYIAPDLMDDSSVRVQRDKRLMY